MKCVNVWLISLYIFSIPKIIPCATLERLILKTCLFSSVNDFTEWNIERRLKIAFTLYVAPDKQNISFLKVKVFYVIDLVPQQSELFMKALDIIEFSFMSLKLFKIHEFSYHFCSKAKVFPNPFWILCLILTYLKCYRNSWSGINLT